MRNAYPSAWGQAVLHRVICWITRLPHPDYSVNSHHLMSCKKGHRSTLFVSWHVFAGRCWLSLVHAGLEHRWPLLSGEKKSYCLWKWNIYVNVGWRWISRMQMFSYNRSLQILWALCERLALWSEASIIQVHHVPWPSPATEVLPNCFIWKKKTHPLNIRIRIYNIYLKQRH